MIKLRVQMIPVFFSIGCVDHQEVFGGIEPIEISIVNGTAGLIWNHRVLTLSNFQRGGVIRQNVLQEWQRLAAFDNKAPHVRYIEKARLPARGQMLMNNAVGILNRHLPAAEFHQLSAQLAMTIVENGFF